MKTGSHTDVYEMVTERFIEALEQGVVPIKRGRHIGSSGV